MKKVDGPRDTKRTLVWAIDPRQRDTRPSAPSVDALVATAERMNLRIMPVTVYSPSSGDPDQRLFQCVSDVQSQLNAFLKAFPALAGVAPKVLVAEQPGQEAAVTKLLQFCSLEDAAGIAVSSHGWSGLDRLFLGSFAETLLKTSTFPVFFLSHEAAGSGDEIFFPTDFSADSLSSFIQLLDTISGAKPKLTIFHAVTYPLPADMGLGVYVPDSFLLEQKAWAEEQAAAWVSTAKHKGVEARSVVRVGGIGLVTSEELLAVAGEFRAGTVVLTTKSNSVGRTLFGSIAYPVFRANQCLTLVYGPKTIRHAGPGGARVGAV